MPNLAGLLPVLTLLLGYGIKYFEDWVQHNRTLERERETRSALRQDAIVERRTQFQRQTLLELQTSVMALARHTSQMHVEDMREYHSAEKWHPKPYPDEMNENCRAARAQTSMLFVRVNDVKVRDLAIFVRKFASEVVSANGPDESLNWFVKMSQVFEELQERIGIVLRALDEDDSKRQEGLAKKK
jgi:hypothetical protein